MEPSNASCENTDTGADIKSIETLLERKNSNISSSTWSNIVQNAQIINSLLQLIQIGVIKIPGMTVHNPEEKQVIEINQNYKTPSFSMPIFEDRINWIISRIIKLGKSDLAKPWTHTN